MRTAFLRGRDHTRLGSISARAAAPAAIAISRGGSPKVYRHTDPNEDAAVLAAGPGGLLVAVADAHDGFAAAEICLDSLLAHSAQEWTLMDPIEDGTWPRHALAALAEANAAIRRKVQGTPPPRSATTLALAVVRPHEKLLFYAAIGDSHLFQVNTDSVVDRARSSGAKCFFLGWSDERESSLRDKCVLGVEPLGETRAVVLATDGLSERHIGVENPRTAVMAVVERAARSTPDRRPLETACGVVETALEAQRRQGSGDNVASAVIWLEGGAG